MQHQSGNVLVTGGAGYTPVVYESMRRGNAWTVKWGPLEVGDLIDGERVRDVLRKYRPAGVIHFAAFAYVGESMQSPLMCCRNTVGGTVSL